MTVDGLNECDLWRPQKREWTLNYYITQCTGSSIRFGDQTSWRSSGRENQHPERLGPKVPGWAAHENGKETLMAMRLGVNMLQFCSVSNSLSHITLSIKWEVYFSKELCHSSFLCRYDTACICIMWRYNSILRSCDNTTSAIHSKPAWSSVLSLCLIFPKVEM